MSFEYILFGKMGVIMSYKTINERICKMLLNYIQKKPNKFKSLKKSNLRQIIGQIIDILLIFENIFIILNNI